MDYFTLDDVDFSGKRVLIREDFNVPLTEDGGIENDARIQAALPGIRRVMESGARVLLMSHLGRPTAGTADSKYSLKPVAQRLESLLGRPVRLVGDYLQSSPSVEQGECVLLENVRFNPGEMEDDEQLAQKYANLCDLFVMDAFGAAHRAQASTHGVVAQVASACAGPLLSSELATLSRALKNPDRPFAAIVGGSKLSGKLPVLQTLVERCDVVILGGGIANTFLAAAGHPVGRSLHESQFIPEAKELIVRAKERGVRMPMAVDVVVSWELSDRAEADVKLVSEVGPEEMILDIGPETGRVYIDSLRGSGTIVWNGPIGVFEYPQFAEGTRLVADAVASSGAFTLVGGGDSIAALDKFSIRDRVSYISTGGGAFLKFLEGKPLPAVAALEKHKQVVLGTLQ